jgi:hypothetical protein
VLLIGHVHDTLVRTKGVARLFFLRKIRVYALQGVPFSRRLVVGLFPRRPWSMWNLWWPKWHYKSPPHGVHRFPLLVSYTTNVTLTYSYSYYSYHKENKAKPGERTMPRASKLQVKKSHFGLDRPLKLQEGEAPRIPTQSAYEGDKVVSPKHPPPLPPRRYFWYSILLEVESTAWP